MILRHSNRPIFSLLTATLLALAVLGCAQLNSDKWYDSDKAKPKEDVKQTSTTGTRWAGLWDRVTNVIDRRPQAQKKAAQGKSAASPRAAAAGHINVRKGDTYFSLAQRHKVPLNALLQANGARPPYALSAGDLLVLPQQQFYEVKRKDTLYSISRRHNTDAASLARLNAIAAPYTISVGQMLQIPNTGKTGAARQAATDTPPKSTTAKKPKRMADAPRRVGRFRVPAPSRGACIMTASILRRAPVRRLSRRKTASSFMPVMNCAVTVICCSFAIVAVG